MNSSLEIEITEFKKKVLKDDTMENIFDLFLSLKCFEMILF